tara:strand:- start:4083 stop:4541 length:459 start_codon:yes stop_codon:yes gene_type:complete
MLKEYTKIKNLKLKIGSSEFLNTTDLSGKKTIFYFYPKDDTPGCTKEAINFSEKINEFSDLRTQIFGISRDSPEKHEKFIKKHDLKVNLISDDGEITEYFGVWVEKSMYGKSYMGIERSTFLIDEQLKVIKIWRKVKVPGHVEEVLDFIKNI